MIYFLFSAPYATHQGHRQGLSASDRLDHSPPTLDECAAEQFHCAAKNYNAWARVCGQLIHRDPPQFLIYEESLSRVLNLKPSRRTDLCAPFSTLFVGQVPGIQSVGQKSQKY